MPYRLRYKFYIDWVGAGEGPMGGATSVIPGMEGGGAQSLGFANTPGGQNVQGSANYTQPNGVTISGAVQASDVATLVNGTGGAPATGGMAQDVYNQITAASVLARLQSWVAGNG